MNVLYIIQNVKGNISKYKKIDTFPFLLGKQ